ncbi:hypothetical protein R1sor_009982 [Riccia sorocarpa]|uniref:Uncharacterized protein n=1 Tax=Riccia sorocarpa TaxID=122646 RepID=A0ABD3I0R2_9MARC
MLLRKLMLSCAFISSSQVCRREVTAAMANKPAVVMRAAAAAALAGIAKAATMFKAAGGLKMGAAVPIFKAIISV